MADSNLIARLRMPMVSLSRGDGVLWTNTSGLYGGLTASLTHNSPDTKMDRAYYLRPVTSGEILAGNARAISADPLRNALASRMASR